MRTPVLFAALATVIAAAPLAAQDKGSRQTRDYVQMAGQSDAFEMLEAQMALTQSSDPQVRAFAQRMLQDHGQTSHSLAQATAESGLKPPPMSVGADQAPLLAALQSVREPEFDKVYWRHQVIGHSSALTTAQKYAADGDDPAVRQAAAASVPVIIAHLATAQQALVRTGAS
ncbi:MAG: DUF4142 domain-containing protein [Janthinobacterium lividum]